MQSIMQELQEEIEKSGGFDTQTGERLRDISSAIHENLKGFISTPQKAPLQKMLEAKNAKNSITPYFQKFAHVNKQSNYKTAKITSQRQNESIRRYKNTGRNNY